MNWQSITIGTSFALFVVWMERMGRLNWFFGAAAGDYVIVGSRQAPSGSVSGDVTPAQSPPNATRAGTGAPAQATQPSAGPINPATGASKSPPAATSTGAGVG